MSRSEIGLGEFFLEPDWWGREPLNRPGLVTAFFKAGKALDLYQDEKRFVMEMKAFANALSNQPWLTDLHADNEIRWMLSKDYDYKEFGRATIAEVSPILGSIVAPLAVRVQQYGHHAYINRPTLPRGSGTDIVREPARRAVRVIRLALLDDLGDRTAQHRDLHAFGHVLHSYEHANRFVQDPSMLRADLHSVAMRAYAAELIQESDSRLDKIVVPGKEVDPKHPAMLIRAHAEGLESEFGPALFDVIITDEDHKVADAIVGDFIKSPLNEVVLARYGHDVVSAALAELSRTLRRMNAKHRQNPRVWAKPTHPGLFWAKVRTVRTREAGCVEVPTDFGDPSGIGRKIAAELRVEDENKHVFEAEARKQTEVWEESFLSRMLDLFRAGDHLTPNELQAAIEAEWADGVPAGAQSASTEEALVRLGKLLLNALHSGGMDELEIREVEDRKHEAQKRTDARKKLRDKTNSGNGVRNEGNGGLEK